MTRLSTDINVPKRLQKAAWIILAIGLTLKLVAMLFFPPHFDSNYYLNIGSNFIERNGLTPYMWRLPESSNIIAGSGTGYGIVLQALWFQVFGLSLFAGRLYSFIMALAMLAVVFVAARIWFGKPTAWYALLFGGASSIFFASFTLRMDAAATFAYAAVLLLHVYAVYRKGGIWHFFVGLLAILTTEMHILGLVYVGGLAFYYGVDYLRNCWQDRRLMLRHSAIYYYMGALCAGIVYLFIHVLPNPEAYFLIPNACVYCEPHSLLKEIGRVVNFLARYPIEAVLVPATVYAAFRRGRPEDRHFGVLLAGCVLSLVIISPPNQSEYTTHLLPLFLIGIATWFAFGFSRSFSMSRQRAANLTATAMLAVSLAFFAHWLREPPPEDSRITFVRENIPADRVIMGNVLAFHQLLDYPLFLSYRDDERYTVLLNGETYYDFWEREQPDVFLPHLESDQNYRDWRADDEWTRYMAANGFREIREGIWLEPSLYQMLMAQELQN